jgi:multiple sugar transport system substrate-binding protein
MFVRAGITAVLAVPMAVGVATAQSEHHVAFQVGGDPEELAAYQTLVDAFEAENPDVDVEIIHIPDEDEYLQRFTTDLAAGDPADIVLLNYRKYAYFAVREALEPLAPYLEASSAIGEADFIEQALAPFRWNGALTCIPQNFSSLVTYYNKDLFDAAGVAYPSDDWTWDDFVETAKQLTLDTDGDGTTDQYGVGVQVSTYRLSPFLWQNGGDQVVLGGQGQPVKLAWDTPASREAIQWFVDLQTTNKVAPDAEADAAEGTQARFLNGRLAMYLDSRRPTPTLRTITDFDWDVAALPVGKERAGVLHSDGYCMTAASKDKDATWRFIEYANSPEGQAVIAGTGRTVPSLTEVANSPAFLAPEQKPANSQVWLSTGPSVRAVPVMPDWLEIEDLSSAELKHAFYGEQSVDEAITNAITLTAPLFAGGD